MRGRSTSYTLMPENLAARPVIGCAFCQVMPLEQQKRLLGHLAASARPLFPRSLILFRVHGIVLCVGAAVLDSTGDYAYSCGLAVGLTSSEKARAPHS
ncbi:hypothetical protein MRX96_024320 [Rhipicephalus microplus]